jgi:hypothetical protein
VKIHRVVIGMSAVLGLTVLAVGAAISAQDRYTLSVPGGLAFADFRGYQGWQVVNVSQKPGIMAVILGNPVTIDAYKSGIPLNGKPFPDGARMAKIHWVTKTIPNYPGQPTVPGTLHDVDFMVKDSKKFADSGGWGYAQFEYDTATAAFRPGTESDMPPQGHDAKCGAACHTVVKNRDYVFTEFPDR